eukprot:TRINITY_DN267_c0_g1_i2.p1 TRINITY_DN267_c0_g1~~TRINITY_DN267_c0_g1_i2.p1  ORF type:complete len:2281 (+),score=582.20 TRINITY_DN267_c0_g1_i2:3962-10804(+)
MGKKKVDVKFRLELLFEEKATITKELIKSYIEDNVKGLKVKSISVFKQEKGTTLAEVESNLQKVFFLGDTASAKTALEDSSPENIGEKLLHTTRLLASQMKAQKITNSAVLKAVENMEVQALANQEFINKLKAQAMQVQSTPLMPMEDITGPLKQIIEDLNTELKRLSKENEELVNEKMKKSQFGDSVLLEQIEKLEQQLKDKDLFHHSSEKELDSRIQQLAIEVLEKDDQIRDLKSALSSGDTGMLGTYMEDYELTRSKVRSLESKCGVLSEEMDSIKQKRDKLLEDNKKLTSELAGTLEELSQFEGSTAAKEYKKKKLAEDKKNVNAQFDKLQEFLSAKLSHLKSTSEGHKAKIESISQNILCLKEKLADIKTLLVKYTQKIQEKERELAEAEEIKKAQADTIKAKDGEVTRMRKRVTELEYSNTNLEKNLNEAENAKKTALKELKDNETKLKNADEKILGLNQHVESQEVANKNTKRAVEKLQDAISVKVPAYFGKISEALQQVYETLLRIKPNVEQAAVLQKEMKESLRGWIKKAEQLSKQTEILNDRLNALSTDNVEKQQKIMNYEKQKAGSDAAIATHKAKTKELEAKVKELEEILEKQKGQIVQMENDNEALNEVYTKTLEKEIETKKEIFETNVKAQEALEKYEKLSLKYAKGKTIIPKLLNDFFAKALKRLKQSEDMEVALVKRVIAVVHKLNPNGIIAVKKMKQLLADLRKGKEASDKKVTELTSGQGKVQEKFQETTKQKSKLEERVKQYEISVKERDDNLASLNAKFMEVKKRYKAQETKSETLEKELKNTKEQYAATVKSLKAQFKLAYKKLEDSTLTKTKQLFSALATRLTTKISGTNNKAKNLYEQAKGLKERHLQAKVTINSLRSKFNESEKLAEEKGKTIAAVNRELVKTKAKGEELEKELKNTKEQYKIAEKKARMEFKAQCKKLQEIGVERINKGLMSAISKIAKQAENMEIKFTPVLGQLKVLKERQLQHKVDEKAMKAELEKYMKLINEKEKTIAGITKELEKVQGEVGTLKTKLQENEQKVKVIKEEMEKQQKLVEEKEKILASVKEDHAKEKQKAEGEIVDLNDKLKANQTQLQGLNNELSINNKNLKETEQQLKASQEELAKCQRMLEDKEKSADTTTKELSTLKTKLETSESTVQRLNTKLSTTEAELEKANQVFKEAKDESAKIFEEKEKTLQNYEKAQAEIATLNSRINTSTTQIQEVTVELGNTKTKLQDTEQKLENKEKLIASTNDQLQEKIQAEATTATQIQALKADAVKLKEKLDKTESELSSCKKLVEDKENTIKELEKAQTELSNQCDTLRMDHESILTQYKKIHNEWKVEKEEYEKHTQSYNTEITKLKQAEKELRSKYEGSIHLLEGEIADLKKTLESSQTVSKDMQKELFQKHLVKTNLSNAKEKLGYKFTLIPDMVYKSAERVNELVKKVTILEKRVKEAKLLVEEKKAEVEKMKGTIKEKDSNTNMYKEKMENLAEEKKVLEDLIENTYKKNVAELNEKVEGFNKQKNGWKKQIKELMTSVVKLLAKKTGEISEKLSTIEKTHRIGQGIASIKKALAEKSQRIADTHSNAIANIMKNHKRELEKAINEKEQALVKLVKEHNQETKDCKEKLVTLETEKQNLQTILTEKEQSLQKLKEKTEKTLSDKDQSVAKMEEEHKKELNHLKKQLADLESSSQSLSEKSTEQNQALANLAEDQKKEIEKLTQQLKDLEAAKQAVVLEFNGKLTEKESAIIKQKEEHDKITEKFNQQLAETGLLKQSLEQALYEKEKSMARVIEEHKQEVAKLKQQLASLETEKHQLAQATSTTAAEKDQALTKLAEEYKAKLKATEASTQKLEQTLSEKEQTLAKLAADHKKETEKLNKQIKDADDSKKKVQEKEQVLAKSLEDYKKQIANYEAVKQKLEKHVNDKAAENKKEVEKLTHKISEQNKEIQKLSEHKKELDNAIKTVKEKENEIRSLSDKLIIAEKEHKTLGENIMKKEEEIKLLKETEKLSAEEYRNQLTMMVDQISATQGEYDKYKAESMKTISELTNKAQLLETQLKTSTQTHTSEKKGVEISQLQKLQTAVRLLRKEIIGISEELKTAPSQQSLPKALQQLREIIAKNAKALPVTAPSTPQSKTEQKPAGPDERVKFVREIMYLCKTSSQIEKSRIEFYKSKMEKLEGMIGVMNELIDPKVAKDLSKLKTVAAKHVLHFPYLKSFDIKNDIKYLAACMIKVVEHKAVKTKKYQEEHQNATMRLGIADQNFKKYEKKLAELQEKKQSY